MRIYERLSTMRALSDEGSVPKRFGGPFSLSAFGSAQPEVPKIPSKGRLFLEKSRVRVGFGVWDLGERFRVFGITPLGCWGFRIKELGMTRA